MITNLLSSYRLPALGLLLAGLWLTGCASAPRGTMKPSDRPLDMAIDGEGFFIVETGHGGYLFTRKGDFSIDSNRYLVTADGYRIAPTLQIPDDSGEIKVSLDGQVASIAQDSKRASPVGQFRIATFANPGALERDGVYYLPTGASGDPVTHRPGSGGAGTIKTQVLEK